MGVNQKQTKMPELIHRQMGQMSEEERLCVCVCVRGCVCVCHLSGHEMVSMVLMAGGDAWVVGWTEIGQEENCH